MKHFTCISFMLISTFLLSSCSNSSQSPILLKDSQAIEEQKEEKIDYEIEKVILSKGYQIVDPNVKLIKKDAGHKLMVSLGLVNSSGADITGIYQSDSQIDIHVKNKRNRIKVDLVVPQILVDLKDTNLKDIDNLSFNIINENYEPIHVKINSNEAINKINADFGIATSSLPSINISMVKDDLFWHLNYINIFDKYNRETPLVNLSVKLDANTGDIIKSSKEFISSFIDEGYILDYIPDRSILYKKIETTPNNESIKEELWVFNIDDNSKELLYSSENQIQTATFSPDFKNVSILESLDKNKSLYILELKAKKTYKILFKKDTNPEVIKWRDNKNIYIVDNRLSNSIIYNYNIEDNNKSIVARKNENIVGIDFLDEKILISKIEEDGLRNFYITDDFESSIFQRKGFTPKFISNDIIGFSVNHEKENKDVLYLYDLEKSELYDDLNLNICNVYSIDEENLFVIERNQNTNDYTLHMYNIKNKSISALANINNSNIYLNSAKNMIYLDSVLPYEENKKQIIYSLDLDLLKD